MVTTQCIHSLHFSLYAFPVHATVLGGYIKSGRCHSCRNRLTDHTSCVPPRQRTDTGPSSEAEVIDHLLRSTIDSTVGAWMQGFMSPISFHTIPLTGRRGGEGGEGGDPSTQHKSSWAVETMLICPANSLPDIVSSRRLHLDLAVRLHREKSSPASSVFHKFATVTGPMNGGKGEGVAANCLDLTESHIGQVWDA